MADVQLTFYCSLADGLLIAQSLRDSTGGVVHLRNETVFGRDFSDASPAECVSGQLDRHAIDAILPETAVDGAVARVAALKRGGPVRWHVTPVLSAGRLS